MWMAREQVRADPPGAVSDVRTLNLRILRELGDQVRASGARFVVADATRYHIFATDRYAPLLAKLCAERGFVYLDAGADLTRAGQTAWPHDKHWNERGNRVFAESLAAVLKRS